MFKESDVFSTLKLSPSDRIRVLDRLDELEREDAGRERRTQERFDYRPEAGLTVRIEQPGGSVSTHLVAGRNISTTGLSFLHGGFLHIGTRCTVRLIALNDESFMASGRVSRCRSVHGRVHEVGLKFDRPLELAKFITVASAAAPSTPPQPAVDDKPE
jgi:hypothetical protein